MIQSCAKMVGTMPLLPVYSDQKNCVERRTRRMRIANASLLPTLMIALCLVSALSGCSGSAECPVSEPAWLLPPEDSVVQNEPAYGYYFVNEDRSIWAAAWWVGQEENYLIPGEGLKTGWFRPAGATLEITGQRLDGEAPALEAQIPCCYPTRFQATGLYFPTQGCWEVTAKAEDSLLTFVVWVEP